MRPTYLKFFFTSQGLGFIYFWVSLAIPYLMYRGLSAYQAFSLMSLYQIVGVLLEYPTGALGDRFGYKNTLLIANSLNALSMVILAQSGGIWLYIFGLVVLAIGTGFSSGNNLGMLKTVSNNLRKDTANLSAQAEFVIFLSSIIGAWIGAISYELALYISAAAMFSANLPLYFLPNDRYRKQLTHSLGNIVKDSFISFKNPIIPQLFLIIAIYGGFWYTTKSIIGSFVDLYGYDLKLIGLFIGLNALFCAVGNKLYSHYQGIAKIHVLIFLATIILSIAFTPVSGTIVAILLFHIGIGYVLSSVDGDLHELVQDHTRSSLFSLKRLLMRLFSSGYLLVYGLFINQGKFGLLMFAIGAIMFLTAWITRKYSQLSEKIAFPTIYSKV